MSTTLLGSVLPRRLASGLIAASFGLSLALNPISAPKADAAVSAIVGARAVNVAAHMVGAPYRYGGASPRGFDCSGLTMYSYSRVGKRLPRTTQQQYRATIRINPRYARPGDLVFFYSGGTIYHVGVYSGKGYMYAAAHAGTRVRKQKIWTTKVLYGRVR
jgi:cell wall-associated NlpC family hydrolase